MEAAAEAIGDARQTNADADAAVGRDDFKYNIEDAVADRIALEGTRFCDADEEDCENDPPHIVRELAAELLADELAVGFEARARFRGHGALDPAEDGFSVAGGLCLSGCEELFLGLWIVGVDAEGALFVDVGIAHGDDDGVDADVHHDYVEDQQADAQAGDCDDVEATTADGEGLEETVNGASAVG